MVNTCHYACAEFCFASVSRLAVLTSFTELYCRRFLRNPPSVEKYLPFGMGNRKCIGQTFAEMVTKIMLVYIVGSFDIAVCPHTKEESLIAHSNEESAAVDRRVQGFKNTRHSVIPLQPTNVVVNGSTFCYAIPPKFGLGTHAFLSVKDMVLTLTTRSDSPIEMKRLDEAHLWLNGYVNKQNCRIWSEANPQVYVETPLHPEKLTVWCALWAGGILQKRWPQRYSQR
ncbi:hypothetical protein TNCV_4572601 [Trichonephila clavipes]|nr:hypothetical protein TNCV_4572601 [Trichonephila clavipes]